RWKAVASPPSTSTMPAGGRRSKRRTSIPPSSALRMPSHGSVHFVGHSMGGLLARVYIARYQPKRLGRVVMLGTPNGGSEIADRLKHIGAYRAWFGPAGQQLVTQCDTTIAAMFPPVDYPVAIS